jgi:hypothetical protein
MAADQFAISTFARSRLALSIGLAACSVLAMVLLKRMELQLLLGGGLDSVDLLPGMLFGAVLAYCANILKRFDIFHAAIVVFVTTVAWYAASQCALYVHAFSAAYFPEPPVPPGHLRYGISHQPYHYAVTGVWAGLVGAVICWIAVATVRTEARSLHLFMRIASFGTVAGTLLELHRFQSNSDPFIANSRYLLFLVWQAGIAAFVVYHIESREE